ncbi:MAG TPA: hypothetical protein VJQ47_09515 [Steroidobacteraceae bacterium]|nr:hypothetical protein [Steroidobacteraceae bacterium]
MIRTAQRRSCSAISLSLAAIAMFALHSRAVRAEESHLFKFDAFGTLGVVHSDEGRADFVDNSVFSPKGVGYSDAWSANVDTKIGGQVTANFTPRLAAVVQVIVGQRYDNTYHPDLEWANLKYQLTPDLSIRAGRIVLSSFMFSDTRKVGYANPWVRPPVEVYSLVPISNSDGVDVSYRFTWGDFIHTLVGTYGENRPGLPTRQGGGRSRARRLTLVADTIEYGALTVHVAFLNLYLTVPQLNALLDAFRQFGPQGVALADRYDENDKLARFFGVGAQYDPGKWFAVGEWGHADQHSALGRSSAWYVTGGGRFRAGTPYLTYSESKAGGNTSDPGLTLSSLPPFLVGPATQLNGALNAVLGSIPVQKTLSVGARWDFAKNVALKLQYDHIRMGDGSPGTLINLQPGFQPGGTVNLFSAAIDFVL